MSSIHDTPIPWADKTLNIITGCKHLCFYCYAREFANRFNGGFREEGKSVHEISRPALCITKAGKTLACPFPYGFEPTFHKHRLGDPARELPIPKRRAASRKSIEEKRRAKGWPESAVEDPRLKIFASSMSDPFGHWVPLEWIKDLLGALARGEAHDWLLLTKHPKRAQNFEIPENVWVGTTVTSQGDASRIDDLIAIDATVKFLSLEPLLGGIDLSPWFPWERIAPGAEGYRPPIDWIIIGELTGPAAKKRGKTIEDIAALVPPILKVARQAGVPVFVKGELAELYPFRQFPEVRHG
ncbi:MAG: DUF5131 family protein [Candidatus Aquicultorales bacterium]